MGLSLKYSWDINIWKKINSKIGQAWNVVVWLTALVVLQIILQVILEIFSFEATTMKIVLGGVCGIYLATMPRLERKSKQ